MNINDQNDRRREIQKILQEYFVKNPDRFFESRKEVESYTLEDRFMKGILTLNDLDWLINNNITRAEKLGLRLSWRITKNAVFAQIFENESMISDFSYTNGFIHRRLAEMQFDFDHALSNLEASFMRTKSE